MTSLARWDDDDNVKATADTAEVPSTSDGEPEAGGRSPNAARVSGAKARR